MYVAFFKQMKERPSSYTISYNWRNRDDNMVPADFRNIKYFEFENSRFL